VIFQAGDQVVHWNYGLGEIIQVDEKRLYGQTLQYYMVKIRDLTIWVPVSEAGEISLRYPTPPRDFEALFSILSGPAQLLSDDRLMRKTQLGDQLKDGKLSSVCQTVRDLTFRRRTKKMSETDKAIMERAQNFLLSEWAFSLSITVVQARTHLNYLLDA
jgi:RNA polymerase-interacting CarD/CdnL/TRCF family regulator